MNSINRQQPEANHADLSARDAVEKMKALIKKSPSCFFCTAAAGSARGESDGVRPMSVQDVDDDGTLWFLSAADSHKNLEVATEPAVDLYFQGSSHSDFLHVRGRATVSRDKAKIKELWEPIHKTWFTEGVDDPRITVIRVTPLDGYYWDTKRGMAVAGVKMLIGAVTGKTLDDSIEGRLTIRRFGGSTAS
jgi:general stress protein 26